MPICVICKQCLPPDLCVDVGVSGDTVDKKCLYCHTGKKTVCFGPGTPAITKEDAVMDYKIYLGKLKDLASTSEAFREAIVDKAVRDM